MLDLSQLAIRSFWPKRQRMSRIDSESDFREQMPKGGGASKAELPYRKVTQDTKTRQRYAASIRKEK